MEQSLHQLQSELQIDHSHAHHTGGYLSYIKSKYPTEDKGDIDSIRKEWKLNFECSQFGNHDNHSKKILHHSKQQTSLPLTEVDPDSALEIVMAPNSSSGTIYDSPNLILFDNFVIDGTRDCSVDYGNYVPSNMKHLEAETGKNGENCSLNEVCDIT